MIRTVTGWLKFLTASQLVRCKAAAVHDDGTLRYTLFAAFKGTGRMYQIDKVTLVAPNRARIDGTNHLRRTNVTMTVDLSEIIPVLVSDEP